MVKRTLYMNEEEWEEAKGKSEKEGFSLASVIRALIRMWLKGEVEISL